MCLLFCQMSSKHLDLQRQTSQRRLWFCHITPAPFHFTWTPLWVEEGKVFICSAEMRWTTVCRLTASLPLKEQTRLTFVVGIARGHFFLANTYCLCKAVDSQTWLSDTRVLVTLAFWPSVSLNFRAGNAALRPSRRPNSHIQYNIMHDFCSSWPRKNCGTENTTFQKNWKCYSLANYSAASFFFPS